MLLESRSLGHWGWTFRRWVTRSANAAESGQVGAVLRAEPNALEFVAWSSADPTNGSAPAGLMSTLPESTLFAAELTGGSELVAQRWDTSNRQRRAKWR